MFLALWVGGLVVALVLIGLFVFGLRRMADSAPGGTFDCSLRWNVPEEPDLSGKGWVYGVARYSEDRINWFRVFSYAPRPRRVLERSAIEVVARRLPEGEEEARTALRRRGARLSPWGDPPGAGHERRRADRIPRLAGGGSARPAGQRGLDMGKPGRRGADPSPRLLSGVPHGAGGGFGPCGLLQTVGVTSDRC